MSEPTPAQRAQASDPSTGPAALKALAAQGDDLALLVAQNPGTPPALLQVLHTSRVAGVRSAVMRNPNTPFEVLLRWGPSFVNDVLQNPALPLLLLEVEPQRIPAALVAALAGLREAPEGFVRLALRAYELWRSDQARNALMAVAKNPTLSAEDLRPLLGDEDWQVRRAASKNPKAPKELLALLHRAGASETLEKIAPAPPCTLDELEVLVALGPFGRELAAHNEACTPALLLTISKTKEVRATSAALRHPAIPEEAMLLAAELRLQTVHLALVQNPAASVAVLEKVAANNYSPSVCEQLVFNRRSTAAILRQVARYSPRGAAAHPNASPEVLRDLSTTRWSDLRVIIASHPRCPVDVLDKFAHGDDPEARAAALRHPSIPRETLQALLSSAKPAAREQAAAALTARGEAVVPTPEMAPRRARPRTAAVATRTKKKS